MNLLDALAGMNVPADLRDGDIVTDVVIIARVVNAERETPELHLRCSEGTDWIVQNGLLALAQERSVGLITEADDD